MASRSLTLVEERCCEGRRGGSRGKKATHPSHAPNEQPPHTISTTKTASPHREAAALSVRHDRPCLWNRERHAHALNVLPAHAHTHDVRDVSCPVLCRANNRTVQQYKDTHLHNRVEQPHTNTPAHGNNSSRGTTFSHPWIGGFTTPRPTHEYLSVRRQQYLACNDSNRNNKTAATSTLVQADGQAAVSACTCAVFTNTRCASNRHTLMSRAAHSNSAGMRNTQQQAHAQPRNTTLRLTA